MNIEEFKEQFSHLRDVDKVDVDSLCDHPEHILEEKQIGKAPAKRNILKHGGEKFICRQCMMKHDNPMNHVGEKRQTNEKITVYCPHPDHEGEPARTLAKTSYYGEMKEPYLQICKSCSQLGREVSDDARDKIRLALTGIKRSNEFKKNLSEYMKTEGRETAINNIIYQRGSGMSGLTHSEETKNKMSEAKLGKKFTEEHRQNISEGRKKMLKETGGFTKEHKEKLSQAAVRQYDKGFDPKMHHRTGWHTSPKAGKVFHRSSFEKKAYLVLDNDDSVLDYKIESHQLTYYNPIKQINSIYIPDIEIIYKDGRKKLVEVKPHSWLKDEVVSAKIAAASKYAADNDMEFEVWSEVQLFGPVYNTNNIQSFMDSIDPDNNGNRKELNRKKAKKHYDNVISKDKVSVECDYCKKTHEVLRSTYNKNVKKNGRYICGSEGGSIAGKKSGKKKVNPYAAEGKKQCNKCKEVVLFENFNLDKSRSDGYYSQCKKCVSIAAKLKYKNRKIKRS